MPRDHQAIGRKGHRLSPERFDRIVALVQGGNYLSTAAQACGIGARTLHRWMSTGAEVEEVLEAHLGEDLDDLLDDDGNCVDDNPLPDVIHHNDWTCWRLRQQVRKAEAEAEAAAVLHVRTAMPENWTAAMTYLERKDNTRWGRRMQHEVAMKRDDTTVDDDLLEVQGSVESHDALRLAAGLPLLGRGEDAG